MGLLTDPGAGRGKLTLMVETHHGYLCVFLYLLGLVWFALLAHEHFNAGTYFSENALLPGLVEGEYDEDHTAKRLLQELRDEASRFPESIPYSWLLAKFGQLGLESYTHNFTLEYPLGPGAHYRGKNVYAILRAPRGASTEAVVLSVPYRPPNSAQPTTQPGVALLLSLAKYFRRQKYWAKDVVFLITEHEQLGAQAWLEAYHQAACGHPGVLLHGDLPARAGAIQAAVNLELHSDRLSHVDVKVEGLNGQLPNLDLVNLVHRLCAMEAVRHTFKNRENANYVDPWRSWWYSLQTLMSMVMTQATGMTNGNHGLFHRFGIEAVTLEGFQRRSSGGALMFYQMGRVMEGICRSLNNLLERFHQSFFFYLLSATDHYISIGTYMPSLGLMCGALLIRAFALWLCMHADSAQVVPQDSKEKSEVPKKENVNGYNENEEEAEKKVEEEEAVEKEDEEEESEGNEPESKGIEDDGALRQDSQEASDRGGPVLVLVGATVLAAHVLGMTAMNCPRSLTHYGMQWFSIPPVDCVWYGAIIGNCMLVLLGLVASRTVCRKPGVATLLNIAGLLELSTLLLAVSMHNFSLAFVCAALYTPVALAVGAFKSRFLRVVVRLLWLLLHPLFLLVLAVALAARTSYPEDTSAQLLARTSQAGRNALLLAVLDSLVYGSWAFNVAAGTLLPAWLLFWVGA